MTFEDVKDKVENDVYRVKAAYENANGFYVDLRGDGSNVVGNRVKQLEYYMETEDDFQKVVKEYI
jgi:hypothetical protein